MSRTRSHSRLDVRTYKEWNDEYIKVLNEFKTLDDIKGFEERLFASAESLKRSLGELLEEFDEWFDSLPISLERTDRIEAGMRFRERLVELLSSLEGAK